MTTFEILEAIRSDVTAILVCQGRMDERLIAIHKRLDAHVQDDNRVAARVQVLENSNAETQALAMVEAKSAARTAGKAHKSALGGAAAGLVAFLYAVFDAVAKVWPGAGS